MDAQRRHLLLQTRTRVPDDDLEERFRGRGDLLGYDKPTRCLEPLQQREQAELRFLVSSGIENPLNLIPRDNTTVTGDVHFKRS